MSTQTLNPASVTSTGTGGTWTSPGNADASDNVYASIAGWTTALFSEVKLLIDSAVSGDNKSSGASLMTTDTYYDFGGAADKWGTNPTVAQVNSGNFGFVVKFTDGVQNSQYLTAKFNFTIPGTATVDGFSTRVEASLSGGKSSALRVDHMEMTVHYTEAGSTYTITASAGSFTLTGQPAGLKAVRKLSAATGVGTITGQPASLEAGRILAAEAGAVTTAGQDAALTATRTLADSNGGLFATSGQDATLHATRSLTASGGTHEIVGGEAQFRVSAQAVDDGGSSGRKLQPRDRLPSAVRQARGIEQRHLILSVKPAVLRVSGHAMFRIRPADHRRAPLAEHFANVQQRIVRRKEEDRARRLREQIKEEDDLLLAGVL